MAAMDLQVRDVAALLSVSGETIRRWANAGLLPAKRLPSGHRRFDAAAVLRFKRDIDGTAR
jgi:excisionase family DNA binding protein